MTLFAQMYASKRKSFSSQSRRGAIGSRKCAYLGLKRWAQPILACLRPVFLRGNQQHTYRHALSSLSDIL
jgi:hypothetical protein